MSATENMESAAPPGAGIRRTHSDAPVRQETTDLLPGHAIRLLTGARVPDSVRAVAMQEACRIDEDGKLWAPVLPDGENIRRRGEDVAPGALLLEAGVRLDPRHLALLTSAGLAAAPVRRRTRVALLSSGNELLTPGAPPRDAAIHDSNRPMLAALLAASGAEVVDIGLLPDRRDVIAAALAGAAGCDAIIASGGVSGSEADHLLGALRDAGGEGSWVAIALKPGKPLVFGQFGSARCLFLPGNPVVALVGALLFARPLLARLAGHASRPLRGLPARLAAGWERKAGREEFAPAMAHHGEDPFVERIGRPGSARLTPLVAADGLLRVSAAAGTLHAGDMVEFFPFDGCFGLT
jgi:molybdopterin molybdotransferase